MRARLLLFLLVCPLMTDVAPAQTSAPATSPAYPETNEGLKQFFHDILDASAAHDQSKVLAMTRSLVLNNPQPWFKDVFGEDKGLKLATKYEQEVKNFPESLARLFLSLAEPKQLNIEITRVETVEDPKAKSFQVLALAAMQNPVPLYAVKITKPGTSAKIEIWSIVYADGGFRWVGKLQGARD